MLACHSINNEFQLKLTQRSRTQHTQGAPPQWCTHYTAGQAIGFHFAKSELFIGYVNVYSNLNSRFLANLLFDVVNIGLPFFITDVQKTLMKHRVFMRVLRVCVFKHGAKLDSILFYFKHQRQRAHAGKISIMNIYMLNNGTR